MKRLFFAVDIVPGKALLETYDLIRYRLRLEKINWVSSDQMHITLAFLGDTESEVMPDIISAAAAVFEQRSHFDLTLSAAGVFKNLHDPRIFWIGCRAGPEFQQVKSDLDRVLAGFGYEPDNRVFSPHLTLGRIKGLRNPNQLAQLITLYKEVVFQQDVIRQVVLYESRLTTVGPEYTPVQVFTLK